MPSFTDTSEIFADEQALDEDNHPDELPERSTELKALHQSLAPAARGAGANNVFLYGKAGQGKTATAKAKLRDLHYYAEQESDHLNLTTCYVSCEGRDLTTTYKLARYLYSELSGEAKPQGVGTDVVMDMLFEEMNEVGGTIIFILDEIDQLGSDDTLLYSLPRARAQGLVEDHVYPSVVGISNNLRWRENLNPKVKSSLYDDQILFSPYDSSQLRSILRRRAVEAFQQTDLVPVGEATEDQRDRALDTHEVSDSGEQHHFVSETLTEDVIPLVAALAARDTGDARQAINYLRKAAELAHSERSETVRQEHVRKAEQQIDREIILEALHDMPIQAQSTLCAVVIIELAEATPVDVNQIYTAYSRLLDETGGDLLTKRRLRDHLRNLDMQGILSGKKFAGGSPGGPSWRFELAIDTQVVLDVLVERLNIEEWQVNDLVKDYQEFEHDQ